MLTIRQEKPSDAAAREALLDAAYGPVRFTKPSERLRAGRKPARGLSFVAVEDGRVVGTVRLWEVSAGADRPALLLGPLAVASGLPQPRHRLGADAARAARRPRGAATRAVLLVGDAAYYGRFGFSAEQTGKLWLPGLAEPQPPARPRAAGRRARRRPRTDPGAEAGNQAARCRGVGSARPLPKPQAA